MFLIVWIKKDMVLSQRITGEKSSSFQQNIEKVEENMKGTLKIRGIFTSSYPCD